MSARVEDQLRDYFAAVDAVQDRITVDELETREPDETVLSNVADLDVRIWRRRHWSVGALTVAAVALLVFTLAAITRDETGSELIPAVTPPTEPAITTTTVAAVPIVAAGEDLRFAFTPSDVSSDVELSDGVWFKGALYALGQDHFASGGRTLHRSTDGLKWEEVSELPATVGYAWHSMLQTDGERLVNVVMPERGTSMEVFTSLNGDDWTSTTIEPPTPIGSNMAGEFGVLDGSSGRLAVGPKGIVLAATVTLTFEIHSFASTLVSPDEGIHVEVVDLDLDRGVMIVRFLDENNEMSQIGELEEVDLNRAGFSGAYSNLLDAIAADPDWSPHLERFLVAGESAQGFVSASVGYAWHSPDGINWQRIDNAGPLDGGKISAILATPEGFVATASQPTHQRYIDPRDPQYVAEPFDSGVVWESTDGLAWTQAAGLTSQHGLDDSRLAEWQGDIIELFGSARRRENNTETRTLTDPPRAVFPDVSTQGMILEVTELGLIGTPTYGWEEPEQIEILFSPDGTSWNRWEPPEIGQAGRSTEAWLVGVGPDFVVVQARHYVCNGPSCAPSSSQSLWVGRLP